MSYSVKYRTSASQIHTANKIIIDICKKDYVGDITILRTEKEGISITLDTTDYFDIYASTSCELQIINNLADFFELDELFSISDFEYYVIIYDSSYTYFEGFIPCDVVEQTYLPHGTVTLNATNNLKRLSDFVPTMFTIVGGYKLIDILHHLLSFTGLSLPIHINCSLFANGMQLTQTNRTLFDQTFVYSEVFLSNDTEFKSCADILTDILTSVDCKLYYWNGVWRIERIKDLGTSSVNYIIYIPGDSTIYHSTVTNSSIAIGRGDDSKVRFANANQVIKYTPGKKQVKLSLKEDVKLNLVSYYFNNIQEVGSGETVETYNPDFGTWEIDNDTTQTPFTNLNGVLNGVKLHNTYQAIPLPSPGDPGYNNALLFDEIDQYETGTSNTLALNYYRSSLSGLYGKFRFTVNPTNETQLTIKISVTLPAEFLSLQTTFMSDKNVHPDNWKFYARIYLRNGPGFAYFVHYNTSTQKYELVNSSNIIGRTADALIVRSSDVSWGDFTNKLTYTNEFTITIPIDDFKDDLVSTDFIIGVCELGYRTVSNAPNRAIKFSNYGDIYVTVNNEDEDNVVTGNVNLDFVDVLEQDVTLYDVQNLNILNGLFLDVNCLFPTLQWYDAQGYTSILITEKMIEDRFQLYHKVRREITSDIYYQVGTGIPPLRPFVFLTDSHFTNKFYVNGFQWKIESNIFENTSLKEYVGDANIT
jgi:hypothetical protein